MFSKVLLPVDLNHKASWSTALQRAVEIVEMSKGELHVLSVTPDFGMAIVGEFFPENYEKMMLEKAAEKLQAFADKNIGKKVTTKLHLAHGHVAEKILKSAEDLDIDLIVMASHDPDRIRDFLVGSNAERIVRHSPVSVLITRG